MKEIEVVLTDDLDRTEKDTRTRAAETRFVGLDGVWVEIDLTGEHGAELSAFIARYMAAGRKPEKAPRGAARSPAGMTPRAQAIERNKAMLAFAVAHNLPHTPARTGSGVYFPVATQRAYDAARLAAQQEGES